MCLGRQERWYSGGKAVFWMRGKLWSVRAPPQGDQVTQDEDDETLTPHTRQAQVCLPFCLSVSPRFLSLHLITPRLSFSLPCFFFRFVFLSVCYLLSVFSFVSQSCCQSLCISRSVCFCLPVSPRFLSLRLITFSVSLVCRGVSIASAICLPSPHLSHSPPVNLCLSCSVFLCLSCFSTFFCPSIWWLCVCLSVSLVCRVVFIDYATCSLSPHLFLHVFCLSIWFLCVCLSFSLVFRFVFLTVSYLFSVSSFVSQSACQSLVFLVLSAFVFLFLFFFYLSVWSLGVVFQSPCLPYCLYCLS